MIRILFLINTLGGGGAERVLVNLVNAMDTSLYDVTVKTMFEGGENANRLAPHIHWINCNFPNPHGISALFKFFPARVLYNLFIGKSQYDIIVAYLQGAPVKVISGCRDNKIKKIVWLHNSQPSSGAFTKFWLTKKSAINAYKKSGHIVGVSENVIEAFKDYSGLNINYSVVHNTNDIDFILKQAAASTEDTDLLTEKDKINIISVGRLIHAKGYERLLKVCNILHNEGYIFSVTIIGDGQLHDKLQYSVDMLHAESWFHLIGFRDNPYAYVAKADLFVCSSYTEGLSTAVTEAVILGVPVVSTDVSGAKEILGENNEYGIVTENSEEGIYSGIKQMLLNKNNLTYYAQKAKERASFFATEKTVKEAEDLFKAVLNS